MEFRYEREGEEDLEDDGLDEDRSIEVDVDDEDDIEDDTPLNLFISCQQQELNQPCVNCGKCLIFDQATGTFMACEHLLILEDEEPEIGWEEN